MPPVDALFCQAHCNVACMHAAFWQGFGIAHVKHYCPTVLTSASRTAQDAEAAEENHQRVTDILTGLLDETSARRDQLGDSIASALPIQDPENAICAHCSDQGCRAHACVRVGQCASWQASCPPVHSAQGVRGGQISRQAGELHSASTQPCASAYSVLVWLAACMQATCCR